MKKIVRNKNKISNKMKIIELKNKNSIKQFLKF